MDFLARADIAVRRLALTMNPLESMFFALTQDPDEQPVTVHELAQQALLRR